METHVVGAWLSEQQGGHAFSSYPQAPHPGCLKARHSLPTFSGRPHVLNLFFLPIQNLLPGFMPLDPAIKGRQLRILKTI